MIRRATPSDYRAIRSVIDAAFGRADEADLVERLRSDGDVQFELVEIADEAVVGHILFSRMSSDSSKLYAALAPVSVRPDLQRVGLGGRLIRAGLETTKALGTAAVIVLGHPSYYAKFGFSNEATKNLTCVFSGRPGFMAIAMEPGALDVPAKVIYPRAFRV